VNKRGIVPDSARPASRAAGGAPAWTPQALLGAAFVLGAASRNQLPQDGLPEIAFAGRSNAGKSSAINALANRTRLAYASRTPGRTQQINFFALRDRAWIADLPGYGYAAVAKDVKRTWQDFLWEYVSTRSTLIGLVLVVDARRGLMDLDRALLDAFLPSGRPVLLLATKCDKLNNAGRRDAVRGIEAALTQAWQAQAGNVRVVAFSAANRTGAEAADAILAGWLAR
jgi:GTP-binding protein